MNEPRCKESVYEPGGWGRNHQCHRKPTRDGYCKQHHPESVKARAKASEERYERQRESSPIARLIKALGEIESQAVEIKTLRDDLEGALTRIRDLTTTDGQLPQGSIELPMSGIIYKLEGDE